MASPDQRLAANGERGLSDPDQDNEQHRSRHHCDHHCHNEEFVNQRYQLSFSVSAESGIDFPVHVLSQRRRF